MDSEILPQSYIFIIFILNGALIGLIFDIFRTFRKSFKTSDIITYIQDILFWIISGGTTLYLIFYFNNGKLRAYIFLGVLIGVVLYVLFISKLFMKISVSIILFIKKIIGMLLYPLKKLFLYASKIIKKIKINSIKFSQKSSKNYKKINNLIKNYLKSIKKKENQ